MLVVTAQDIKKLHKTLSDLSTRALPHAAKNALNTSAFAVRREWAAEGKRTMTVRNKWTFGGKHHRVNMARLRKQIRQMKAETGNTHKYMAQQERGVTRFALWRKGVGIPTIKSRIGRSKKRIVREPFWKKNMSLGPRLDPRGSGFAPKRGSKKTRMQRYVATSIQRAKRQGKTLVYLDFGAKRGIYDVATQKKTKMVWDMSKKRRTTKPNPMLRRTLRTLRPAFPIYHRSALEDQVRFVKKKHGLR